MTFIEDSSEGINLGNPAGFMASKIEAGISANQALRDWRDLGGSFTRQDWLRGYAGVRETLSMRPEISGIDPGALPTGEQYGEWAMGRGEQYATQVQMLIMDRDTGLMSIAQYTHISDDPHTPDEAVDAGMDAYGNAAAQSRYNQRIMGGLPTAMWQTVPFGS